MRTTISTIAICGAIALPCNLFAAPASSACDPPAAAAQEPSGSATAEVYHSVTGAPLADMPVYVWWVSGPDGGTTNPQVFVTGRDGRALLSPLDDGVYVAYVEHNNNQSNKEQFEIDSHTDVHPIVVLWFNPDID